MFKCENCLRSMETGKCNLSVRDEDSCMTHKFAMYREQIPEQVLSKQQRAIKKLTDAIEYCMASGLDLITSDHTLYVVDAALMENILDTRVDELNTYGFISAYKNNKRVMHSVLQIPDYTE